MLPIVGNSMSRGHQPPRTAETRSLLRRLVSSMNAGRRRRQDSREASYLVRLDRAIDLIEHETCDCL